jgi:hypothetical protein
VYDICRVIHVRLPRHPLQIGNPIVRPDLIAVINHWQTEGVWNERLCHYAMYRCSLGLAVPAKLY